MPMFTEAPMDQLRSMIMRYLSGFGLALVMKGEQLPKINGVFFKGTKFGIVMYLLLNICIHITGKFCCRFVIALLMNQFTRFIETKVKPILNGLQQLMVPVPLQVFLSGFKLGLNRELGFY